MESLKPIFILGPTGSGKSALAVRLAELLGDAEIVSADAYQVYRGMEILTAAPTAEELRRVPHHLVSCLSPAESQDAATHARRAQACLSEIAARGKRAIVTGGSGLYVDALCNGFDPLPQADPALRQALEERLRREGLPALVEELKQLDPVYWAAVDRNNPARVLRALEVCRLTGQSYSDQRKGVQRERPFRIVKLGIDTPREELYDRINRRVDAMMQAGLLAEAERMFPLRHLNALRTVGYQELFAFLEGHGTLEEAVELIKRNSRRYAKRQLTWFRRDASIRWFGREEVEAMKIYCEKFAET